MSRVAKILNKAADLIEQEGWCQFRPVEANNRGGYCRCATAAISAAADWGGGWYAEAARIAVGNLLRPSEWEVMNNTRSDINRIVAFNDATGRRPEEVVAKLREAANGLV